MVIEIEDFICKISVNIEAREKAETRLYVTNVIYWTGNIRFIPQQYLKRNNYMKSS